MPQAQLRLEDLPNHDPFQLLPGSSELGVCLEVMGTGVQGLQFNTAMGLKSQR